MTTIQKAVVAAPLVVVGGVGIYEALRASGLRTQVQALQQAQAPLAEQVRQLTRERDDATGKLEVLRDDNERLNRNALELLRLRSEVGVFRREKEQFRTGQTGAEQKQSQGLGSDQNADWPGLNLRDCLETTKQTGFCCFPVGCVPPRGVSVEFPNRRSEILKKFTKHLQPTG